MNRRQTWKRFLSFVFRAVPLSLMAYWWFTSIAPDLWGISIWFRPTLVVLILIANLILFRRLLRYESSRGSFSIFFLSLGLYLLLPIVYGFLWIFFGHATVFKGMSYLYTSYVSDFNFNDNDGSYERVLKPIDLTFIRDNWTGIGDPWRYRLIIGTPDKDWCDFMQSSTRSEISGFGRCAVWNPFRWKRVESSIFGFSDQVASYSCTEKPHSVDDSHLSYEKLLAISKNCTRAALYIADGVSMNLVMRRAGVSIEKWAESPGVPEEKRYQNLNEIKFSYSPFFKIGNVSELSDKERISIGTFLGLVAHDGDKETIRYFLDKGIDINIRDSNQETPLLNAVWFGQKELTHELLERGADPNAGKSVPLTRSGSLEMTKELISHGADVNFPGANLLGRESNPDIVKLLIDHGAKTDVKHWELAPVDQAIANGNKEVVMVLENGKPSPDKLMLAEAAMDHIEEVRALLDQGVDPNSKIADGRTALHLAVRIYGHLPLVKFLLDRGANINAQNSEGDTPLMYAKANPDRNEIAKLLLERDADVSVRNKYGETALHIYIYARSPEVVKLILAKKPDLNARTRQGFTPLKQAIAIGPEMETLLRDAGATN